jgi:hypothetical protein
LIFIDTLTEVLGRSAIQFGSALRTDVLSVPRAKLNCRFSIQSRLSKGAAKRGPKFYPRRARPSTRANERAALILHIDFRFEAHEAEAILERDQADPIAVGRQPQYNPKIAHHWPHESRANRRFADDTYGWVAWEGDQDDARLRHPTYLASESHAAMYEAPTRVGLTG